MLSTQWAYLIYAIGALFGCFGGFIMGVRNEAKKKNAHYTRLINSAMANAYNAGFTDAATTGKKRPSGNGAK